MLRSPLHGVLACDVADACASLAATARQAANRKTCVKSPARAGRNFGACIGRIGGRSRSACELDDIAVDTKKAWTVVQALHVASLTAVRFSRP